jgi:hypothetical protein
MMPQELQRRRDAVLAAECARCAAILQRDFDRLASLLGDELVHIHAVGEVDSKASYLARLKDQLEVTSIERGEIGIRFYGEIALATGPLQNHVRRRGSDDPGQAGESFVTQLWHWRNGGWIAVSYHATRIGIAARA